MFSPPAQIVQNTGLPRAEEVLLDFVALVLLFLLGRPEVLTSFAVYACIASFTRAVVGVHAFIANAIVHTWHTVALQKV